MLSVHGIGIVVTWKVQRYARVWVDVLVSSYYNSTMELTLLCGDYYCPFVNHVHVFRLRLM